MKRDTRRTLTHLAILFVACVVAYFTGLTDHGLTNTQESTRLTAAREMQANHELILPTRQDEPYIAKPPVMYWIMMGVAELRGSRVDVFDLRFTVALGGMLGVFATYFAGRVLLRDPEEPDMGPRAAFYAAFGLAGGILYVRSSRIGELDILMIPTVVTAIGCIGAAWRSHVERQKTLWWAVGVATLCSMIAALTKGPIPTAVIGIGAYGAIVAESVFCDLPRSRVHTLLARILAPVAAIATLFVTVPQVEGVKDWFGVLAHMLIFGCLAWGLVRATEPPRAKRWFFAFSRTHPVLVLGAGLGALAWWINAYRRVADPEKLKILEQYEVKDNLRLLVPESPINNLEFLTYGLGAASVGGLIALFWIARDRPRMTTGRALTLGWMLLGLVVFSTMGKGVARYLTTLWPALSLLGGWWVVCAMRDIPKNAAEARTWRTVVNAILTTSVLVNGWWYAVGRDTWNASRSPRDFVTTMLETQGVDPTRVGTYGFETPALEIYLDLPTHQGVGTDYWAPDEQYDWRATPVDALIERLGAEDEPYWLLALEGNEDVVKKSGDVRAALNEARVPFEEVPVGALPSWMRPPDSTPVRLLVLYPQRR